MSAKGYVVTAIAFLILCVVAAVTGDENEQDEWSTHVTPPLESAAAPIPEPVEPVGDQVAVTKVIDGDTFEITGGIRVRPLGIQSCEMNTPGGKEAKRMAEAYLLGETVTLTKEPGVETDQWGRLLRYVQFPTSRDFGEQMVFFDHTDIYQGKNNASPAYLEKLRAMDASPRSCAGPPSPPATEDNYVPTPNSNDDGESRFCRKRKWC